MSLFQVRHYRLEAEFHVDTSEISGRAIVRFANSGKVPANIVSFLMNKGLHAVSVEDDNKNSLKFQQNLRSFSDLGDLKVNHILVSVDEIEPDDECSVRVIFDGPIVGYEDVFPYTKDHIGTDFSLLRLDVFAYPIIGSLNFKKSMESIASQSFNYCLKLTVPHGYVVASGGRILSKTEHNKKVIYSYVNQVPTWRFDAAVAKFKVATRRKRVLRCYVFPRDLSQAKRMQKEVERTIRFYENWFTTSPNVRGYTLIEIPSGWGSQAGADYMLLDEESIKDKARISGLYHELAHLWNIQSAEECRSRFFDEGFASYFQALAEREFLGEDIFHQRMNGFRKGFSKLCDKDRRYFETPMSHYGTFGLTDASYLKGAWALYILHMLLGEIKFKKSIGAFVKEHLERPATIEDLKHQLEKTLGKDLTRFFDEWFFSAKSSAYLDEATSTRQIVAKYLNQNSEV